MFKYRQKVYTCMVFKNQYDFTCTCTCMQSSVNMVEKRLFMFFIVHSLS